MTDLPSRPATRLRRPSWRDSRLLVGVLLVLVSTVLGSLLMARADHRVPMYAARVALVPGDALTADKLQRVDVQLGEESAAYLGAAETLPAGQFLIREIRPGELVPKSAVGAKEAVDVQPVTLLVDATSAQSLVRGSIVDVYVNPLKEGTTKEYAGPERALAAVSVSVQPQESTRFGGVGTDTVPISIMVPTANVAAVIARVDDGSRITVVPVPGSPTKAGT